MARRWVMRLVAVALVAGLCEASAYWAQRAASRLGMFYFGISMEGWDRYEAARDPVLGWRPVAEVDAQGARLLPSLPPGAPTCASAYGDSFTWGDEIPAVDSWTNQLSAQLGCRVANFGASGFGTDQAVLRFEHNAADDAPVAMLVVLSENLLRNVTRNAALLYPGAGSLKLKPRFVLDGDGRLQLLPMPGREEMLRFVADPSSQAGSEYFAPGGPSGKVAAGFPYTLSLLRGLGYFHVGATLRREPWYADFYRPDHPSGALPLSAAIVRRFVAAAEARGKRPLVVLMPTSLDIPYRQRTGRWPYQPLLDRLRGDGIAVLDLGDTLGPVEPCDAFVACRGHLNARGSGIVAGRLAQELRDSR